MNRHYGWIVTLIVLGTLLLLLMVQVDRQWQRMVSMQNIMSEQSRDLRTLRRSVHGLEADLASGRFAGADAEPSPRVDEVPSAFRRAAAAATREDYAEGDWLVQAFGTGLATITPYVSSDAYAAEVQNYVLESLVLRDPETLEWQGLLAESWEFDASGTELTFRLRGGLQFSDGTPLSAEDVEFTYDFLMNDAIAAPRARAFLEKVEAVEALDSRTVRFVFEEPYFDAMRVAGGLDVLPKHFYESYLEAPETFNESRGILLGSGPYRLEDPTGWTPDAGRIELERNPRYWGPLEPPFDRLVWRVIQNDSARLTTFRNRDIDVYGARPREFERLRDDRALRERADAHEYMSPTAGYSYVAWNQERGGEPTRFADPLVRQAMSHLTDVDRLIDEVMLGYAERAISPFSPRSEQHDPELDPIPFNIERALELLAEAGYEERNRNGILVDAEGEPFSFDLVYFQDSEDTRRIALFLRDLYARVGIDMRPQPTEWSVMLERISRKDFDAITLAWTSGVEVDIYQMFHSSQTVTGGDNFIHYRNPELDAVIEAARGEVDEDARMQHWRAAERILVEDQPYTFLMRRQTLAFVDRRLQNLEQTLLGLNLGAVPIELYVPLDRQRYGQ